MTRKAEYLVLGAGMMGSAVAYDLATTEPGVNVVLADADAAAARRAAAAIGPNVSAVALDVNDGPALRQLMGNCEVVVSAVSYAVNEAVTHAAIETGVHMCDLGGNNEVVDRQLALSSRARERGVMIVPNCGLAPGLVNILAVSGMKEFDRVETIQLRVGGLPVRPRPPLNYQIVFSVEGLINEYIERSEVLRDGQLETVESLTDLEELEFPPPFGRLEAFHTSGGISTLTRRLQGYVQTLDYKTIRYPGHCEKIRTLLDLGFASAEPLAMGGSVRTHREVFTELLRKKLSYGEPDVVLLRATLAGTHGSLRRTLVYECVDYYDAETKITAMMRATSFPTAVTAQMLRSGAITDRGVLPPEDCVSGDAMIAALLKRNIVITERLTESAA
jgi:lysine 6-dehydrogenase